MFVYILQHLKKLCISIIITILTHLCLLNIESFYVDVNLSSMEVGVYICDKKWLESSKYGDAQQTTYVIGDIAWSIEKVDQRPLVSRN